MSSRTLASTKLANMTDFGGACVYPRYSTPQGGSECVVPAELSGEDRFRASVQEIARRCQTRADGRSVAQRRAAKHLISP
jgi:hypothetical protein